MFDIKHCTYSLHSMKSQLTNSQYMCQLQIINMYSKFYNKILLECMVSLG